MSRFALAGCSALLVAATAPFAFGVAAERRSEDDHGETSDAYVGGGLAAGAGEDGAESPAGGEGATHEDDEALLEVSLESTPLVIAGVVVPIALAALVGLRRYTRVLGSSSSSSSSPACSLCSTVPS